MNEKEEKYKREKEIKIIAETEDYNKFYSELDRELSLWRAKNNISSWKRDDKNFCNDLSWETAFVSTRSNPGWSFYLWGPSGMGKSKYLEILKSKRSEKAKEIKSLNQIECEETIYLFDAVNESINFSKDQLDKILKVKNVFVIYSGWDDLRQIGYRINPSDELIEAHKNWKEIKKYCWWHPTFSIREKYLMCNIKHIETIKNNEPHEIVWKAFENTMINEKGEVYKNVIKFYKESASKDPFSIPKDCSDEFKYLLDNNFIQYNWMNDKYFFSHPNIAVHHYFRERTKKIRILDITDNDKGEHKYLKEAIENHPTKFIDLRVRLEEKKKNVLGNVLEFLIENSIKISAQDHLKIDSELKCEKILYTKLTFDDLKILTDKKNYQRIYEEFISENINTEKILDRNDAGSEDISYFVYSIMSSLYNDVHPTIMNTRKKTDFFIFLKIKNETNRQRMLNFLLGRYINIYLYKEFSALNFSDTGKILFCPQDNLNELTFENFLYNCYKKNLSWTEKNNLKLEDYMKGFDKLLGKRVARSILKMPNLYTQFDRGGQIVESAKKEIDTMVNLFLYLFFEKKINPISFERMMKYYEATQKKYPTGDLAWGYNFTNSFEKLMILLFKDNIETHYDYWSNFRSFEPINKFNYGINILPAEAEQEFINQNFKRFYILIKEYFKKNKNVLNIVWKINQLRGKLGESNIWITNYEINENHNIEEQKYSISKSLYTKNAGELEYTEKDGQKIQISKKEKFSKWIVSFVWGVKNKNKPIKKSFIIDLKDKNEKFNLIEYEDIRWLILPGIEKIIEEEKEFNKIFNRHSNK